MDPGAQLNFGASTLHLHSLPHGGTRAEFCRSFLYGPRHDIVDGVSVLLSSILIIHPGLKIPMLLASREIVAFQKEFGNFGPTNGCCVVIASL